MTVHHVDTLILGSGFGGSLLSMILARAGRSVAVVDRGRHPRFAIGESSTPLANTSLNALAQQYNLPELRPLTKYGTWKQSCPDITCGVKRGFSYFGHSTNYALRDGDQMLVAASGSAELADTHWLRSDVDALLYRQAGRCGTLQFQGADYTLAGDDAHWHVEGVANESGFKLTAPFVIDATGTDSAVLSHLQVPSQTAVLRTNSRAIFGHFTNVATVNSMLQERGVDSYRHPFPCDAAAVHHVLKNGWMWQLRFDDDTTSAGFVLDNRVSETHTSPGRGASVEWNQQMQTCGFLQQQFRSASVVRPDTGLIRIGRLQRLTTQAAGKNWATLPNTAGFIDPLHSTGIAHTLCGIERLAAILLATDHREEKLNRYSAQIIDELRHVDDLVEGCYAALPNFRLWCDWCMLYFAAVTSTEQTNTDDNTSFLHAGDERFRDAVSKARSRLRQVTKDGGTSQACDEFENQLRSLLQPWNHAGLLDADCRGMYSRTAAPA